MGVGMGPRAMGGRAGFEVNGWVAHTTTREGLNPAQHTVLCHRQKFGTVCRSWMDNMETDSTETPNVAFEICRGGRSTEMIYCGIILYITRAHAPYLCARVIGLLSHRAGSTDGLVSLLDVEILL